MKKEEILEYNKRCVEFLGAKNLGKLSYSNSDYYEHELFKRREWSNRFQDNIEVNTMVLSQMLFYYDWNWIMELVEAIEKLPYTCVYFSKTYLGKYKVEISIDTPSYLLKSKKNTIFLENESKKEAVVEAINQFLIWYNKNK